MKLRCLLCGVLIIVFANVAAKAKFTIVMIGDTEDYTETDDLNQGFLALMRWTADNMKKRNIVFLTHVGDIVQDETRGPDRNLAQWKRADAAFDILDKRVPHLAYSVCQGNHDLETQDRPEGTPTRFHEYYGKDRFKGRSWYGGTSPSGNCHYQFFHAGGRKYLHLNMAWRPSEPDWEWAKKLVAQTHQPTIISTHYYMDEAKKRGEVGAAIFERLVEPNPHVFLVLGGHVIGHARQTSRNSAGLPVFELMSNYEDRVNRGENWFRIIEIDDDAGVIQFRTLTPGTDPANPREKFKRDDTNEFRFELDFRKRFGESASAQTASVAVENPLPVYHETRTPAARSQIGGRGLRLAAIDRQPNGTLHALCHDREDHVSKWISDDNGLTWTQSNSEAETVPELNRSEEFREFSDRQPQEFLEENEREAHLLVLNDGRLLCTFARHMLPNGIFAVVSDDRGKTWNTDEPTYLAGSLPEFFGKPVSIELEDGSILTAHSIRAYRQSSPDNPKGDSVVHVVRWRLPGDTRAPPTPNKEPLLTDVYAWAKYHNAGTGFTGNLQRISYWKKSSAKRVYLPDHYKGAMGRFPNGEMVVASYIEAKPRYSRTYRSADNGASWTKVDGTGEMLVGKEQSILCLNDNKTVLLKTQIAGQPPYSPLYRSADGGVTWSEIEYGQRSLSYPRDLIQFSDGSIAMFNASGNYAELQGAENTRAWRIRSFDGGLTWPERREVSGAWKRPRPFFTEATFLAISDMDILAAARVNGDHVHSVTGEIPPMGLGRQNAEINQKMALIESTDGGLSWSRERFVFDFGDVQAKFLRLADGRILCTYRCRSELPFGVKGVFSQDGGKTWDLDHPVILGVHSTIFGTWQNDIQLPDGTMRTAWARFYDGPPTFEVVHWQLPETQ